MVMSRVKVRVENKRMNEGVEVSEKVNVRIKVKMECGDSKREGRREEEEGSKVK